MNIKQINSSKGFTLLELVVVLSLFMLIMGVTVTMFISIVSHQKRILSQQEMISQASFVQDYISRSLRTAQVDVSGNCLADASKKWTSGVYLLNRPDIPAGFYQGIKFLSAENVCQEFLLDNDGVLKEIKNGAPSQNILSAKFKVMYARFVINGNKNIRGVLSDDGPVPRVSFVLNIRDASYPDNPPMLVQTTISKR